MCPRFEGFVYPATTVEISEPAGEGGGHVLTFADQFTVRVDLFFPDLADLSRLRDVIAAALPAPERVPSATFHPQGTVIPSGDAA